MALLDHFGRVLVQYQSMFSVDVAVSPVLDVAVIYDGGARDHVDCRLSAPPARPTTDEGSSGQELL